MPSIIHHSKRLLTAPLVEDFLEQELEPEPTHYEVRLTPNRAEMDKVQRNRARVARRQEQRISKELLADRAAHLPEPDRSIALAYFQLGMTVDQIAGIRLASPRQIRRRIENLREMLADPCFALVARYGHRLPDELPALARAYWIEARTLREVAARGKITLHQVRTRLALARSLMLLMMAADQPLPPEVAKAGMDMTTIQSRRFWSTLQRGPLKPAVNDPALV